MDTKNLSITAQTGKKEQLQSACTAPMCLPAASHPAASTAPCPEGLTPPGRKSSPHQKRKSGLRDPFPQPSGAPREGPASVTPHPETGKSETYGGGEKQGGKTRAINSSCTVGATRFPVICSTEAPSSFLHPINQWPGHLLSQVFIFCTPSQ